MITVKNLTKTFRSDDGEETPVLKGIDFTIETGTVFTLLGPSGCGKSTTLRSIAGLERPDSGEIYFDNDCIYSSTRKIWGSPEKRELGMVFQSYAIWPHMTVGQNVAYPLENRKFPKKDIPGRVRETLAKVGLEHLEHRLATQLSGGQQQRVALARALVHQIRVLLLDEPLSNLDAKLREQMRHELKRIQKEFGLTTVYVTHDQEEALALSDTVALMKDGEIVEMGKPTELFQHPKHRFTADFIGLSNFVESEVVGKSGANVVVENPFGRFAAIDHSSRDAVRCDLSFRPHNVKLFHTPPEGESMNVGRGTVGNVLFLGEMKEFYLEASGARVRIRTHPDFEVENGQTVYFMLNPERTFAYDPERAEEDIRAAEAV